MDDITPYSSPPCGGSFSRLTFGNHGLLVTDPETMGLKQSIEDRFAQLAPALGLICVACQDFLVDKELGPVDAILVSVAMWRRCALDLFNRAFERLGPGGLLVLIGSPHPPENLAPTSDEPRVPIAWPELNHLIDQARYCGFGLVGKTAGGEDLIPDGEVALLALLRRMDTAPRWRIRSLDASDAPQMRALFDAVFAPNRMSAEHWFWKYGDNRGTGIGAWDGDELVAYYGGVWREISIAGAQALAVQITDVMVLPRARGVLRREGAFHLSAASFLACHIGDGARALLGFGFPTDRAYQVAARRGLYGQVDRMVELQWPMSAPRERGWWCQPLLPRLTRIHTSKLTRSENRIERLWRAMHLSLPNSIVGFRNWDYLRHRYLGNPIRTYEYMVLSSPVTQRWLGLAVLAPDGDGLHLRDFIGDVRHLPALIDLMRGCHGWRGGTLKSWITASHADYFPRRDAQVHDLGIVVPHCTWTAGPSIAAVEGRWWLTGGDTDFL